VTKPVIERVLQDSGVPIWDGYERGFVRTACWCCPGVWGKQAVALEKNYPGLANEVRAWEQRLGKLKPLNDRCFNDALAAGQRQLSQVAKADREVGRGPASVVPWRAAGWLRQPG
jgi:hypothetical protein